jgi:hypothetical protein
MNVRYLRLFNDQDFISKRDPALHAVFPLLWRELCAPCACVRVCVLCVCVFRVCVCVYCVRFVCNSLSCVFLTFLCGCIGILEFMYDTVQYHSLVIGSLCLCS